METKKKPKRSVVTIDPVLHRELKVYTSVWGLSIKDSVDKAIANYLNSNRIEKRSTNELS
jgi:hypothetical protein